MPGARDQKSWDAGLGGTKRDGCGTNPCGCCGSCVVPPRACPPPQRIARFRSLRHKLAAWLDGTPQTGASVTDGPRRGSPASPLPWSGCGPHRVGQSSCRVARMRPRVGIPRIPEDPGIKTSDRVHRGRVQGSRSPLAANTGVRRMGRGGVCLLIDGRAGLDRGEDRPRLIKSVNTGVRHGAF